MPQEPLQLQEVTDAQNGLRIIHLTGPVLLSNFFQFQALLRGSTAPRLILDLTQVPYIDSAGIGALVGAYVTHQKDGRSLALVGVAQRVRNTMQVTRVEPFFSFFDSLASAQKAVAKP
jgi:anti-sigma B factor antagonist